MKFSNRGRLSPNDRGSVYFQGMEYKLNLKTKQCTVSPLNRPFRPFGVPPFAKFVYEATIGAAAIPGEHTVVQVWGGEFENKGKEKRNIVRKPHYGTRAVQI